MVTEGGNSDGSATSAPLGHNILRNPQIGSTCSVWRQSPTVLLFYQQRPRYLAGQSRPSQISQKMDGIQIAHARLLQHIMDILRTFGHSELYGHNGLNPRGLDHQIDL